jgi:hypothetical protein
MIRVAAIHRYPARTGIRAFLFVIRAWLSSGSHEGKELLLLLCSGIARCQSVSHRELPDVFAEADLTQASQATRCSSAPPRSC